MDDQYYMNIALQLARAVKGQTYPNPPVGAVVVNNHIVRGMGAHLQSGEAHAEVHALEMAGAYAEGATIYVTLEPCSHEGKTPPCAQLIIDRGISRVVIAQKDPHVRVAGQGIKMLQEAGITVEVGVLEAAAARLNEVFFHYIQTNRPYVTMKTGVSLDGKIATSTGESQWITGEEARLDVHRERHRHDAILVGIHTVLADDPQLTTRLPMGGKHPVRVILDHDLRTPLDAKVVTDGVTKTIIFVNEAVSKEKIARITANSFVEVVQLEAERIAIADVLTVLGNRGIASLFVEGGAVVNDSFLREGFINQYLLYMAPKLIGGQGAPTSIGGEGIASLPDALQLHIVSVERLGKDLKVVAKREALDGIAQGE